MINSFQFRGVSCVRGNAHASCGPVRSPASGNPAPKCRSRTAYNGNQGHFAPFSPAELLQGPAAMSGHCAVAEIVATAPETVWLGAPGGVPINQLTVIAGTAGAGKSSLAMVLADRASRGGDILGAMWKPARGRHHAWLLDFEGRERLMHTLSFMTTNVNAMRSTGKNMGRCTGSQIRHARVHMCNCCFGLLMLTCANAHAAARTSGLNELRYVPCRSQE